MIDVVVDKERNLKNLKQIGTPQEENKIYVENLAYAKLKEESYKEKRIFILMGHTERMNGRYATFVEAVIPVNDMEFSGVIPKWNNKIWSSVFREIKRIYEDMIIVGWAMDAKGLNLRMTQDLERVHREHFGGIHQLLFLMDSLEKEETFYTYKENKLSPKDGFFIYYHTKTPKLPEPQIALEIPKKEIVDISDKQVKGGQYRELLRKEQVEKVSGSSNVGIAVAVALLIFVIGVGAYENRDSLFGRANVPTIQESGNVPMEGEDATESTESTETADTTEATNATEGTEEVEGTETSKGSESTNGTEKSRDTEATESGYTIPVEIISGEEKKSNE